MIVADNPPNESPLSPKSNSLKRSPSFRINYKDSIQFFFIARGSLYEVETQIIISHDLDYLSNEEKVVIIERIQTCKKLLNGFINYFQNKVSQQPTTINEQLIEYGDYN